MYNHYIPQSDGSYRRSSIPEPPRRSPPKPEPRPEPKPEPKPPCRPEPPCPEPPRQESILSFLKGLLPRGLDTADLMIVFLLLLMNQDQEDGLSPMITLALYFLL